MLCYAHIAGYWEPTDWVPLSLLRHLPPVFVLLLLTDLHNESVSCYDPAAAWGHRMLSVLGKSTHIGMTQMNAFNSWVRCNQILLKHGHDPVHT